MFGEITFLGAIFENFGTLFLKDSIFSESQKRRKKHKLQAIHAGAFFYSLVGGHQTPLKGSLNYPKKVTSRIAKNDTDILSDPAPPPRMLVAIGK